MEIVVITGWLFSPFVPTSLVPEAKVKEAKAAGTYQYTPTAGRLVRGTATATVASLAASAEGINTGSWKGTLADDNFHWVVMSTTTVPTGFDVQLDMNNVSLNGSNKFMVETGFDLDSAGVTTQQVPHTLIQICDWTSATGVDNLADSNCTTGGWRTINARKIPVIATSAEVQLHMEIYDGYFSDGNNVPYSTPLANFINASSTVTFRYYSTTNTGQNIAIDYLRMYAFVSPIYHPAGAVHETASGAVSSDSTSNAITAMAKDSTYLYAVGTDSGGS